MAPRGDAGRSGAAAQLGGDDGRRADRRQPEDGDGTEQHDDPARTTRLMGAQREGPPGRDADEGDGRDQGGEAEDEGHSPRCQPSFDEDGDGDKPER